MDSGPELESDNVEEDNESEVKQGKKDKKKPGKVNEEGRTKEQLGGKKGKKNRRKKDDSDEDIDKVLAELEMEYLGVKKEEVITKEGDLSEELKADEQENDSKKKKKKKEKQLEQKEPSEEKEGVEDGEIGTVKTAAQKKKEKKEREKQKRFLSLYYIFNFTSEI